MSANVVALKSGDDAKRRIYLFIYFSSFGGDGDGGFVTMLFLTSQKILECGEGGGAVGGNGGWGGGWGGEDRN